MHKLLIFTIISKNVSVYWPWKNILQCNQVLCGACRFLFLHKICFCVINDFCLHCMYSSTTKRCTARGPSFPEDISSQWNAFSVIVHLFLVFFFGMGIQIFIAFVQVSSMPLTILTHRHMSTSVVTVNLKLNTAPVRVIHTDNIMYTSILKSLGVNSYLRKLKCTKFTFCIIILKFRICVYVCRGG